MEYRTAQQLSTDRNSGVPECIAVRAILPVAEVIDARLLGILLSIILLSLIIG